MTAAEIVVTVAYAAPGIESLVEVRLRPDARVGDAVAQSGILARLEQDISQFEFAIFGQRARVDTPLRNLDRVEITRPLAADPKRIRAARAAKGEKARPAGPAGNRR